MDAITRALLQYHNTPLHDSDASPDLLLTGRQLRDTIPVVSSLYQFSDHWSGALRQRELDMVRLCERSMVRYNTHAHNLSPLQLGQVTRIQNPVSGKWDCSSTVIEATAPRQYLLQLDGSGRATIRNRRHLRPSLQGQRDPTPPPPTSVTAPSDPRPKRARRPPKHLQDYDSSCNGVGNSCM